MADYERILEDTFRRLGAINEQRQELDLEQARLLQFAKATVHLLPDEAQVRFNQELGKAAYRRFVATKGLTDAIREILQTDEREWLTTAEVRDRLINTGFDFSGYASNPLASVSTTLKRMAERRENGIKVRMIEGVNAYRWKPTTK